MSPRPILALALLLPLILASAPTAAQDDEEFFSSASVQSVMESCSDEFARGVCLSQELPCRVPGRRELARRSNTQTRFWTIRRDLCQASYAGGRMLRIELRKDELLTTPDVNRVWQFGEFFDDSNEALMTFLPSRSGFFFLGVDEAPVPGDFPRRYFAPNPGGFFFENPRLRGMFFYFGPPAQSFVIPQGWIARIDGELVPTGYMLTSQSFIAMRARSNLVFQD